MTDKFNDWLETVCKEFSGLTAQEKIICLERLTHLCGPSELFSLWHKFSPFVYCDFLQYLPLEIAYKILQYTCIKSALQCRLVCKKWNQIVCGCIPLWKAACYDLGVKVDDVLPQNPPGNFWKEFYFQCKTKLKAISLASCYYETKLHSHTLPVRAIKYHLGLLAIGSDDRTVRLWKRIDNQFHCIHILETHSCVALKFDTNIVSTASFDTTAAIWNWQNGSLIQKFEGHTGADYYLERDLLVTGSSDKTVKLWKISSGTLVDTLHHKEWILEVKLEKSSAESVKFSQGDLLLFMQTRHTLSISIINDSLYGTLISRVITLSDDDQFFPVMQFNGEAVACAANSGLYISSLSSLCCIKFIPSCGDKRLVAFGSAFTVVMYKKFSGDKLHIIETKTGVERAAIPLSNYCRIIEPCQLNWLNDVSVLPMNDEPLFVISPSTASRLEFSITIIQWKDIREKFECSSV